MPDRAAVQPQTAAGEVQSAGEELLPNHPLAREVSVLEQIVDMLLCLKLGSFQAAYCAIGWSIEPLNNEVGRATYACHNFELEVSHIRVRLFSPQFAHPQMYACSCF